MAKPRKSSASSSKPRTQKSSKSETEIVGSVAWNDLWRDSFPKRQREFELREQGYRSISEIAAMAGVAPTSAKDQITKRFHEGKFERVEALLQSRTIGFMYRPKQ